MTVLKPGVHHRKPANPQYALKHMLSITGIHTYIFRPHKLPAELPQLLHSLNDKLPELSALIIAPEENMPERNMRIGEA